MDLEQSTVMMYFMLYAYINMCQWPFQEPKFEVPTIHKANVREHPNKIWPYMVQYLYFRILKFPLIIPQIDMTQQKWPQTQLTYPLKNGDISVYIYIYVCMIMYVCLSVCLSVCLYVWATLYYFIHVKLRPAFTMDDSPADSP